MVIHIKKDTTVLPRIGALREVKYFVLMICYFFIPISVLKQHAFVDKNSHLLYRHVSGVYSNTLLCYLLVIADESGVLCHRQPGIYG